MEESLQVRLHGDAALPALIYLPGLHGDWTLVVGFRLALAGRVRFVEFTYPRTLTWSLDAHADVIAASLTGHGITRGWVLAESFGSQVGWALMARGLERGFQPEGLILAGGFVKHPFKCGVTLAARFAQGVSLTWLTRLLFFYAKVSRWRFRQSPEVMAGIEEFIARRTEPDKHAAVHRLRLIEANDPRPIARRVRTPVHQLAGFWDPVVPWPPVRGWLRHECPGWRSGRVLPFADHNVLGTAPRAAAEQMLEWMKATTANK